LELHQLGHDLEGVSDSHSLKARRLETGGVKVSRIGLVVNDENSIGLRFAPGQTIEGFEDVRVVDRFDEIAAATSSDRVEPGLDVGSVGDEHQRHDFSESIPNLGRYLLPRQLTVGG
jgi:hypothetical protein